MNILLGLDLDDVNKERILWVSEDVRLMEFDSAGEALETMPEVDVVLGGISRELFLRGERLRWVQTGVGQRLLYRSHGPLQQIIDERFELRAVAGCLLPAYAVAQCVTDGEH